MRNLSNNASKRDMVIKKGGRKSYGESCVRSKSYRKKISEEQLDILGLKETVDGLAKANGVRWYGHELRRDDDDDSVLRVALSLE